MFNNMFGYLLHAIVISSTRQCTQKWNPVTGKPTTLLHSNSTLLMCKQVVRQPRLSIANKLCLCNDGKWRPLDYGGSNGRVDVQFFGDVLGAAKQLCALFKSIDCIRDDAEKIWDVRDDTDFDLISDTGRTVANPQSYKRSGLVELVDPEHQARLIQKKDLFDVVEGICKFIDDGSDSLPGLLPGRAVDGIFGWLGRLLDGLFDFFDIFNNGLLKNKPLYFPSIP